jgi:hypothetical protein
VAKEYLKVGFALAKGMRGNRLVQAGGLSGLPDGFLNHRNLQMVPLDPFRDRIRRTVQGWKNVLPGEFFGGVGVFTLQGEGKGNFPKAFLQISLVNKAGDFDL